MSKNRLFLIDGSALVYRSYYAFARNPLITSRGEDASVCFGFASTIMRIVSKEDVTHLVVLFDTATPTFRHKVFPRYKQNRKKMPDELAAQLPRVDEMLNTMKITTLRLPGFEADDLIATITDRAIGQDCQVVIVSGDKDLFQLVGDNVMMLNLRKTAEAGERFDRQAVKKKMGVFPEQIIDLLALMGDSSDNIPGVTGVGPKTAVSLLEEFGAFDAIFENTDKIKKKKLKENLQEHKDDAYLARELVTLDHDVDIQFELEKTQLPSLDTADIRKLFGELEFSSLLKRMSSGETRQHQTKPDYQTITTKAELQQLAKTIRQKKKFAFDTETTGLDSLTCGLVGISIATAAGKACYIPIGHTEGGNMDRDICRSLLGPLFTDPGIEKIAQNFKFDYHVLTRAGYAISGFDHDTMIASYILDPAGQHGLDALAFKHLDYQMQPITELIGKGKNQKSFAEVPVAEATFYAAEDADMTFRLAELLEPEVEKIGADKLMHEIELPLSKVLATMESNGVRIDVEFLQTLSDGMAKELDKLIHDIHTLAGREFNINSPSQLSQILFEDLRLKPQRKTAGKTGYSTDMNVLSELAKQHDLPKRMLEYRKFQKLKSTYVDALPALVNPETDRVHTSYNQAIAATGRLSSTDPNLQNIPIRTEEGSQIRKAFVPANDDYKILAADYSQVELRVLAHFCEDPTLIESFREGEDIHTRTASEVYGVEIEDVTSEMRRMAKIANFAVIYGVSAYGLSQQSDMTVAESREFIDVYYARYSKVGEYIDRVIADARERGYVTTLFERRRYLPEINSRNTNLRRFAERTAVNTVIQGTAADLIKIAMLRIDRRIEGMKSLMIMQVHDELVFDMHMSEEEQLMKIVRDDMEHCVDLKVPLTVDMKVGANWLECK